MSGDTEKLNDERHAAIVSGLSRIEGRFDALDARTRSLEKHVSVLGWAYALGVTVLGAITAKLGLGHG